MATSFGANKSSGKSFRIDDLLKRKKGVNSEQSVKVKGEEVPSDFSSKTWCIKLNPNKTAASSSELQFSSVNSQSVSDLQNTPNSDLYFTRSARRNSVVKKRRSHIDDEWSQGESSDSNKTSCRSPTSSESDKTHLKSTQPQRENYLSERDKKLPFVADWAKDRSESPAYSKPHGNPFIPSSSQSLESASKIYSSPFIGGISSHGSSTGNFLSSWNPGAPSGLENMLGYHPNNMGLFNSSNLYPSLFVHSSSSPQIPSIWASHPLLPNSSYLDPRAAMERGFHTPSSHLASQFGIPFMNKLNPLLNLGNKRKGGQIRFSNSQTTQLEKAFRDHKYLNANDRKTLAHSLGLSDKQVKTWFQNRRAKYRKSKDDSFYDKDKNEEIQEPDRVSPAYSPGERTPTYQSRGPTI